MKPLKRMRFFLLLALVAMLPMLANAQTVLWSKYADSSFHGITCSVFLPGDSIILLGAYPNLIYQVDVQTGTKLRSIKLPSYHGGDSSVFSIKLTKDGNYAYIQYDQATSFCKYDVVNNSVIRSRSLNDFYWVIDLINNDSLLIVGGLPVTERDTLESYNLLAMDTSSLEIICYKTGVYHYNMLDYLPSPDGTKLYFSAKGWKYNSYPPLYTEDHLAVVKMKYNDTCFFDTITKLRNIRCGVTCFTPNGKRYVLYAENFQLCDLETDSVIMEDTITQLNNVYQDEFISDSIICGPSSVRGFKTYNMYTKELKIYLDTFWIYPNYALSHNKQFIFFGDGVIGRPMWMIGNPLYTDVEDTLPPPPLIVYPNPVHSELNLNNLNLIGISEITLFDSQSKDMSKYLSRQSIAESETNSSINVSTLPPGVYFLRTGHGKQSRTIKFVKE